MGTGVLGYTAIITDSRPLLAVYTVLIVLVFVFEAVSGLMSCVLQDILKEDLGGCIGENIFDQYHQDHFVKASVDRVQIQFRCCGIESYLDWSNSTWSQHSPAQKVPDS